MHRKIRPLKILEQAFPVAQWARKYDASTALADAIAGFTVALTLIPQSIAYASLAGLDAQYGLYSSLMGGFVYLLMGTCPEINIGPTALLSLLTFTYTHGTNPDMAVLLCFLAGIIQLVAGITRLSFLVNFVSTPVISGFTSASSLIIACSQLKGLLGLSFSAEKFVEIWKQVYEHKSEVKMADSFLSVSCCIILLAMRQMKDISLNKKTSSSIFLEKVIWFLAVGRNAAVVVLCTVVAYLFQGEDGTNRFKLTGQIESGFPTVGLPPFSTSFGNQTYGFTDMVQYMNAGVVVVPLVGVIANVAIAKAFIKGTKLDATQEMIALGVCNLVGSVFRSYPSNGSFSRSAVSNASGVKTPAAGFYTSIVVLLTLSFLTPYFYFIPKAALASVIVCAVLFMVDVKIVKDLWVGKCRLDLIPLFVTFLACLLLDVAYGILVGVALDLIILLFYSARQKVRVESVELDKGGSYATVMLTGGLFFPSSNYIRDQISAKLLVKRKGLKAVVVDCRDLQVTDWTTIQCIKSLVSDFKKAEIRTLFMNVKPELLDKIRAQLGADLKHFTSDNIQAQLKLLDFDAKEALPTIQEAIINISQPSSTFESATHL